MHEKTIQTKVCKHCQASFDITDKDLEFYDKVSPIFAGKKYSIPTPTLCPDCRQQRRLSFRNERKLYKRKCDLTGRDIISTYSPDSIYKVYDRIERRSDKWDPLDYGRELDFNKRFFEQFEELMKLVPRSSLEASDNENSDFTNHSTSLKDCYWIFDAGYNEDTYHSNMINYSKNCMDCLKVDNCELCYNCLDCNGCYSLLFSVRSNNCRDSYFLYNCINCHNCFGSINLVNSRYCMFNKQYTQEEYLSKLNEIISNGICNDNIIKKIERHTVEYPFRGSYIIASENCLGNNIHSSKDVYRSFDILNAENIRYCQGILDSKDCMDITIWGGNSNNLYYGMSIGLNANNILFCFISYSDVSNLIYCSNTVNGVKNCFGCIGLHNNEQYCILNKQYTKAEYDELVPQIIEHMTQTGERGEFFPSSISPFAYNETTAMEYFPLTKNEAIKQGFKRSDYEAPFPKTDAKDVITCEVSGKPFRLIPQEIEFYKKHNLPSPTKHPDIRHAERIALRNPRKLRDRKCAKCSVDIKTTYSPDRPETVYCETCYNKEIYG